MYQGNQIIWQRMCWPAGYRCMRRESSPVRAQGRSHHAAEQYLRVALVPGDRRVIRPQPLSFRFCPLGSRGLLQKQPPGHYSFSTSTLPKPYSASRGALRGVSTPRAFSLVPALRALHNGRYHHQHYHHPRATQHALRPRPLLTPTSFKRRSRLSTLPALTQHAFFQERLQAKGRLQVRVQS